LCQRYFETGTTYDIAVANGESDHQVWYRTTKRANATVATDNETGVTNHSTHYSRTGGFSLNGSAGAGGYTNFFYTWTADSEL